LTTANLTGQYRPNPHLAFGFNNTLEAFRLPQRNFNIELAGLQASYAFNRFVNATAFVQSDTSQTQAVSANVRLRYTFRPDSDLYVIYNAGSTIQAIAAGNPAPIRQQKLVVKVTYSWSR
jgi:outer membrane protease